MRANVVKPLLVSGSAAANLAGVPATAATATRTASQSRRKRTVSVMGAPLAVPTPDQIVLSARRTVLAAHAAHKPLARLSRSPPPSAVERLAPADGSTPKLRRISTQPCPNKTGITISGVSHFQAVC